MDRSHFEDVEKVRKQHKQVEEWIAELDKLRLTEPDSARIQFLEKQIDRTLDSATRDLQQSMEKVQEVEEGIDRYERLTFDVQRQMATLCATLLVAILALSTVFENADGLRTAIGDVSKNLVVAVGASVAAMLMSSAAGMDMNNVKPTAHAPWHLRAGVRVADYALKVIHLLGLLAAIASFWFFFRALVTLAQFLSSG